MRYIEFKDLSSADDFKKIYVSSFVEEERVEFEKLFSGVFKDFEREGQYDGGKVVGLMHFVVKEQFVHLNFFAITNKSRGQGYGSKFLSWLKSKYPDKAIVVDVEELDPQSENKDYRILRQKFYMKNGFVHGEYVFDWRGIFFTYMHCGKVNAKSVLKHLTHIFPDITNLRKCDKKDQNC